MTEKRFNELLAGPLHHPMPMFVMSRLMLALKAVVDECGEAGDAALEKHCQGRQAQDEKSDSDCDE